MAAARRTPPILTVFLLAIPLYGVIVSSSWNSGIDRSLLWETGVPSLREDEDWNKQQHEEFQETMEELRKELVQLRDEVKREREKREKEVAKQQEAAKTEEPAAKHEEEPEAPKSALSTVEPDLEHFDPANYIVPNHTVRTIPPLSDANKQTLVDKYVFNITQSHLRVQPRATRGGCHPQPKGNGIFSTVEYVACCGLGHRLARMAAAAHVAQQLEAGLYGFWKCCDTVDVFSYLFGSEPLLLSPESLLRWQEGSRPVFDLQFRNLMPGFHKMECGCTPEKIESQYYFYQELMDRYHEKEKVQAFVKEHFADKTSIGLHIRAGNGEKGDFQRKGRGVPQNEEDFVSMMVGHLRGLSDGPTVLFVATDTPSYVDAFRQALNGSMEVVDLPQVRPSEGEGVLFGGPGSVKQEGDVCLQGWDAALQDMMLLASTDIVVATVVSSFSHTMPMSLALGRPDRKPNARYCELTGEDLHCFAEVSEWCCKPVKDRSDNYFDVDAGFRIVEEESE